MSSITPNVVKNAINRSHFRPSKRKMKGVEGGTMLESDDWCGGGTILESDDGGWRCTSDRLRWGSGEGQ